MFSIGEFSKITGLTVKTLRFYHEQGLLEPSAIDDQTGYRYYSEAKLETARIIRQLRDLEFPVAEIVEILGECDDDADILEDLERRKRDIEAKMKHYRNIHRAMDQIIGQQREARQAIAESTFDVSEKDVEEMLVAGVRMLGRYDECGKGFARIGRAFGRQISGKPFLLHYDTEFKEDGADFEVCMPIRRGEAKSDVDVRRLGGGRHVTLLHQGPYRDLGRSYARVIDYFNERDIAFRHPTREIYHKGPGMIFRGNEQKYLTEIQFMIDT